MDAVTATPVPRNEPLRTYATGSPERVSLQAALANIGGREHELPVTVDGRRYVPGGPAFEVVAPHDHAHVLGRGAGATLEDAKGAVEAALRAAPAWRSLPFDERAAVLLRAADLLSGPWRDRLNAATMLGQSKTCYQAEIDAGVRARRLLAVQRRATAGRSSRTSRSAQPARGTGWTTARSRASSTRSPRSTSPRSPATCPPRPR